MGFWGWWDPMYFIVLAPALLLMIWAQARVKSAYGRGMHVPALLSGAAAAQHILDSAGVSDVAIEETHGFMSDHYDPRSRTLRLSPEVYRSRSATAVGIAAHEVGHALQHAHGYAPMAIRNAAVPAAAVGPTAGIILMFIAVAMNLAGLFWLGVLVFGGVVFFQLVNLPVEINASNRAKEQLGSLGIVDEEGAIAVRAVLNAAAWTYVAVTLQSILTLLYYIVRLSGQFRRD
jgi:Zn-dependent membrane protease YugP